MKKNHENIEVNKRHYQLMVEKSRDGLGILDNKGIITYVNPGMLKMLGYSREEVIGSHRRKDGTTFPVEVRLVLFESDDQKLMLGISRILLREKRPMKRLKRPWTPRTKQIGGRLFILVYSCF